MQLPIYADPRLLQQLGYPILGTPRAAAPAPTGQRSPTMIEANARDRSGDDWLLDPMTLDRPKAKKKASTDVTDIAGDGDLPQSQSLQDWIKDVVSGGADVLDRGATAAGDFVRGTKQGEHGDIAAQLLRRFPDNIDDARNRMGMDPSGVTGIRPELTEGDTGAGALSPLPRPPIPATASAPAPTPASVAPPTAPPSPPASSGPPIPQISPPQATPAALSTVPSPAAATTEPSMISMIEKALVAPSGTGGSRGSSGISPDLAMALLTGGANMLSAASQPGATFGGALGAGVQGGVKGFTGSKKARADKEEKAYQRRLDRAKLIASAGESEAKRKDARSRDRATADYRKERNQLTREANEQRSIDARERRELADEKHNAALMGVATKIMENNPGMTFDEALLQVMSRVGGGAPASSAGPRTEAAASGPVIERGGKRYQRTAAGWIELR